MHAEMNEKETTVQEVLDEFDRLAGGLGGYTRSRGAWNAASSFLRWCREHHVEQPKLFMWLRFRVVRVGRGSRARPSLQSMASEALLTRYHTMVQRMSWESAQKKLMDTQFERELISVNSGNEAVRRDYLVNGRTDLCEAQINLSGGYHPFSKWCPACPRAASCAKRLNEREGFDVIALRLGKIAQAPEHVRRARSR
jgi:hypothetical protein